MKLFLKIIIVLIVFSCSNNKDGDNCPNWYYLYTYDECSCEIDDSSCETYQIINKEIFSCLKSVLEASSEPCIFIDSNICAGITFNGYIREVVEDCLEVSF